MLGAVGLTVLGSFGRQTLYQPVLPAPAARRDYSLCQGGICLRVVSFPLGFLILMIPIPVIIYNKTTFPLQLLHTAGDPHSWNSLECLSCGTAMS